MTRRTPIGFLISVAVHVVVIGALMRITLGTGALFDLFDRQPVRVPVERVGFISLPDRGVPDTQGQRGGDGRPVDPASPPVPQPELRAPPRTPLTRPPIDRDRAAPPVRGGNGPLVGGGGPLRGIQPSYSDPRLWMGPGDAVVAPTAPKTIAELVDSSIVAAITQYLDSVAALPRERAPGDWTWERDGKKYGIDREYIRLGDYSIPTAILALLPLNVQGNPIALEREKALAFQRADIDYHALRGEADLEFSKAVKRIRERYLRERRERALAGTPPD